MEIKKEKEKDARHKPKKSFYDKSVFEVIKLDILSLTTLNNLVYFELKLTVFCLVGKFGSTCEKKQR